MNPCVFLSEARNATRSRYCAFQVHVARRHACAGLQNAQPSSRNLSDLARVVRNDAALVRTGDFLRAKM